MTNLVALILLSSLGATPQQHSAQTHWRAVTACLCVVSTLDVAPAPQVPVVPQSRPEAALGPKDAIERAINRAKEAFVEDVKRLASQAKTDVSVRVTFPEAPKSQLDEPQAEPPPEPPTAIEDYSGAREAHLRGKKSLAVLIGATWCTPCQIAKKMLPTVRTPRAYLDVDRDAATVAKILPQGIGPLPVLVVYPSEPQDKPLVLRGGSLDRWLKEHSR